MAKIDLKELATRGAAARIAELRAELASLYQAFPALRKGDLDGPLPGRTRSNQSDNVMPIRRRKRREMSAAEKAEVSKRMKKYWAERRAKQA